ncbi:GSCFA domain-containing protein [Chishuiella changwenlii]|uniref:GSCFA domain-containing protein n=1 Tax=Chishuiella changwenlii TaxID=1434701 RepID=UPI002FDACC48
MQFRTTFQISPSDEKINHQQKILTIGSCFSDEIGNRLLYSKFNGLINPFGTIFNAISIQNLIRRSISEEYYKETDVHQNGEQFFCFDVHSSFNALSKEKVVEHLNSTIKEVHHFIHSCDVIMITLGTSWVYNLSSENKIVANCHKVEAKQFDKTLLSTEDNYNALSLIVEDLIQLNSTIKIITTVSPVRHIKDGMTENNVSKARLIDALYQLNSNYKQVDYFPSYELVLDDLRDYRFFKEDMIHPTEQAVDYIWEKFGETFFNSSTQTIIQKINKIQSALHHRPFNETSESHQKFLKKIIAMIEELEKGNTINFEQEKEFLQSKII